MISEPSEEALWFFVLPLPSCFVLCLAGALGQVLKTSGVTKQFVTGTGKKILSTTHYQHITFKTNNVRYKSHKLTTILNKIYKL